MNRFWMTTWRYFDERTIVTSIYSLLSGFAVYGCVNVGRTATVTRRQPLKKQKKKKKLLIIFSHPNFDFDDFMKSRSFASVLKWPPTVARGHLSLFFEPQSHLKIIEEKRDKLFGWNFKMRLVFGKFIKFPGKFGALITMLWKVCWSRQRFPMFYSSKFHLQFFNFFSIAILKFEKILTLG